MDSEQQPLVSVVTPVLNGAASVEKTIESVLGQTYRPIEYIVMDGGSTDGTLEIARRYGDRLTLFSERDSGQTNAINNGLRRTTGAILAYLNADDQYFPNTVAEAVAFFKARPDAAWIYGEPVSISADGESMPFRRTTEDWDYEKLLTLGIYVSQPTTFVRRRVVDEFGLFDESLRYTMDYEYWLRIGRTYPGFYVPQVRALVVRSRATRTQTGGVARSLEMQQVVAKYGGHGVPEYARHLHAIAFARSSIRHAAQGQLAEAIADQRALWRYPGAALWGIAKLIARSVISEHTEGRLRRVILRRRD